ncbi:hypothetical protein BPAE_0079g00170 [Botrytis paeoniae]|uniref:Lysine-specific metallo-endopeptidase domain-containing protein n=1 Tax=Botrytis paeoniae TaxID=278948 RepID=A0A4Z1FPZ4_9HELO|nr:hypothetical protein BPAE_0079g00170 [Botrytis paeoniae]
MGHLAQVAIGASVQNDSNSNLWGFPDTESRDLMGKIFGLPAATLKNFPIKHQYVKNGFDYIMANFAVPNANGNGYQPALPADPIALANSFFGPPAINNLNVNLLTTADVVMYCDLAHYQKASTSTGEDKVDSYVSSVISGDTMSADDFEKCSRSILESKKDDSDAAMTDRPHKKSGEGVGYSIIQFCPTYIDVEKALRYRTHSDLPRFWSITYWGSKMGKVWYEKKEPVIDKISLFCHTLLHELGHAVTDNSTPDINTARIYPVDASVSRFLDGERIEFGPYGWKNIAGIGEQDPH